MTYLLGQQCGNGGFPEKFGAATCRASVDATGFAVQALAAVGGRRPRPRQLDGGRWLKRTSTPTARSPATGRATPTAPALAAQALTAVGRDKAAAKARGFLRGLQVGCGGKAANRGLVRYAARTATGDPVRATSQAVPALAQATLADISNDGVRPRPAHAGLLARC